MILFKAHFEVPFHGIKKNNKQIRKNRATGKMFVGSSDKALFAEKWVKQKLFNESFKQRVSKINEPINLKLTFYYPKSKFFKKNGDRCRKIADISNLYQLIEDCLQDAGIIENDNLIESHDGSRRSYADGSKYYLSIEITKQSA